MKAFVIIGGIVLMLLFIASDATATSAGLRVTSKPEPVDPYTSRMSAMAKPPALMQALPAERTVYSDLPIFPGRDPYRAVLQQVADVHGIRRADFNAVVNGEGGAWIFSPGCHPT